MNRFPAIVGLAILVWQMSPSASAQESGQLAQNLVEEIESAIFGEIERQQIVGASVGIVIDGKIAFVRGFGLADREKEKPATSKTIYNWASNSKPVMAIAAMQLVEAGKLDLDADIRTYVSEFPEKDGVVTTRFLMCHQSGIPHYTNGRIVPLNSSTPDDPLAELDPVVALGRFGGSPLLYKPGEGFSYSSYAYVLLSAVVSERENNPLPIKSTNAF